MPFEFKPYYILTLLVLACGGIPKGWDEGGFSAVVKLTSFETDYHTLSSEWVGRSTALTNRTSNITSFGVLGAAFGAVGIYFVTDRLGRLRCFQLAMGVWATGLLMQIFSEGRYGFLLFTRLFSGFGAGALTVTSPLFLTEVATAKLRGRVVTLYMVFLLFSLSLGFFVNYAAKQGMSSTRTQYRLVEAIPLIPAGLAFIGSFFLTDTPRWLASKGRSIEAINALARLRNRSPDSREVLEEYAEIEEYLRAKAQDLQGVTIWQSAKEVWTVPSYRKRYLLVLAMHTVAQWSGGNGITYYITTIFSLAGINGTSTTLISGGAYGIVKLLFTVLFAWSLIDYFGRRRCFTAGLLLQLASHIYMGGYMGTLGAEANSGGSVNVPASNAAIASVFIYAVGWSIGLCTIPYIYSAEIFPTRIRSFAYSTSMFLHWMFQFAVVKVVGLMFDAWDVWGAYLFYALVCFFGGILLWVWAPETKGVEIERMDELFCGKWYLGWRARAGLDERMRVERREKEAVESAGSTIVDHSPERRERIHTSTVVHE